MIRLKFLACLLVAACVWSGGIERIAPSQAYAQSGSVVRDIRVVGNKRIAPETVKTHVKSIFVKLGVDKRAHAVARAQALGLLVNC